MYKRKLRAALALTRKVSKARFRLNATGGHGLGGNNDNTASRDIFSHEGNDSRWEPPATIGSAGTMNHESFSHRVAMRWGVGLELLACPRSLCVLWGG